MTNNPTESRRFRAREVMNWLKYKLGEPQKAIASRMGYSPAFVASVLNGKVPLSDKFIRNLCSVHQSLNVEWVMTGECEMLKM